MTPKDLYEIDGYRYESKKFRDLIARSYAQGLAEARAKGWAVSVVRVLDRRGVPMTDADRSRILSCTDQALLVRWLDRSLDATTIEDVLAD